MRRHLLLPALIVAIVIAIAFLRPGWRAPSQILKPAVSSTIPADTEVDGPNGLAIVPSTDNSPPVKVAGPAKPVVKESPKARRLHLTVEGLNGEPAANAVVLVLRTDVYDPWREYQLSESRTDKEGKLELDGSKKELVSIVTYKTGEGGNGGDFPWNVTELTLKLLPLTPLRVMCTAKNGALLPDVELVVRLQMKKREGIDMYGQRLIPLIVSLPPRRAASDSEGRCTFDGVLPGCTCTVEATWQGLKTEKKFDFIPRNEVQLVLE